MNKQDYQQLALSGGLFLLGLLCLDFTRGQVLPFDASVLVKYIDDFFKYVAVPLVLIEVTWSFLRKDSEHDKVDSRTNLLVGIGRAIIEPLAVITIYVKCFTWGNELTGLSVDFTSPLNWIIGFLYMDLCYYWDHRLSHKIKFFWANHSIHHSSEHYNFLTSSRGSWIECSYRWIFLMPMALLGFAPLVIIFMFKVLRAYQLFQHTGRYQGNWKTLSKVIVTPESHRLHHAIETKFHDKNFGGIFSLWDHLFGTAVTREEGEEIRFGATNQTINNSNPLSVVFAPIINYFR